MHSGNCLSFFLLLFVIGITYGLNVELQVKECAGVGSNGYPVTTVIPLAKGAYQDVSRFRVTDASGITVPAQIEILNRRWAADKSIAHLQVTYMPRVPAFTGSGTGMVSYYLKDDGAASTSPSVSVTETSNDITVITGPLKFIVKKSGFNILDRVWYDKNNNGSYTDDELVVKSNNHNGGQLIGRLIGDTTFKQLGPSQYDADRSDASFEIEKRGPGEVVIRAEAVTKYSGPSDHTHGWAVRIYAYAGKPYIKVDYQLQNSPKTKIYGWPLYFHALNLNFDLNLGSNVTVKSGLGNGSVYSGSRGNGVLLAQKRDSLFNVYGNDGNSDTASVLATGGRPDGFMDIDDGSVGVTAITRNFWRMWPNGLKVDAANRLSVEFFPDWSANVNAATKTGVLNKTHLYWLQDMQHVYKEVVLNFHNSGETDANLIALAKTVDYHPIATLALAYARSAAASVDLEGFIPSMNKISTQDLRVPGELSSTELGWNYYQLRGRRFGTAAVGGTPFGGAKFWATENPADWFISERQVIGEMNTRPEWMAQYNHEQDFSFLHLGVNSVGDVIAPARFDPHSLRNEVMGADMFDSVALKPTIDPGLSNMFTFDYTSCIDNCHLWRYHVADGYWITGNPWLKDFYKFQAEYRKNMIKPGLIARINFTRDYAHAWAEAFQAYRVTGDTSIVRMMVTDVRDALRPGKEQYGGNGAGWQLGFFMRPLIGLLQEVRESNPQAWAEVFQAVAGAFDCNLNYGNFTYDETPPVVGHSYYGSYTLMDPQAWYYWYTGKREFLNHLNNYIDWGIGDNGTLPMYKDGIDFSWMGDYSGNWVQLVRNVNKPDSAPPTAVTDLTLKRSGNQCVLAWTAPADAKKYHVVWDNKPIVSKSTNSSSYTNWWAAKTVGPSFQATPGSKEHLTYTVPDTGYPLLFAAVFSWDTAWNMSAMSNTACQDTTPATAPANLRGVVVDANNINLTWGASIDPESGIWRYLVYRNGVKIAEVDSVKFSDHNLQASVDYSYDVSAISGSNVEGIKAHIVIKTIADTVQPFVSLAHSISLQPQIMLYFSEQMDSVSINTAANYALNNGRVVKSAVIMPDLRGVILTCDTLDFAKPYQLTIHNVKDLAAVPNTINSNAILSFVHRVPLKLDSTVHVYKPGLVEDFEWDTLQTGKTPFMDWSMPIVQTPVKYKDLPMLKTACNDNAITALADGPFITFKTNKTLKVYVMLDDRQPKPAWLTANYTNTGDDLSLINSRNGVVFPVSVYASNVPFAANSTVSLPGLGGDVHWANYFFAVEPLDSSWVVFPSSLPAPALNPSVVWDFLTTAEGWTPDDCPSPTVSNSIMTVTGWQAAILSPANLGLDATKYSFVKLVMRNQSTDSVAKFSFSNTGGFAPAAGVMTFKTHPSDSLFRTYVLDLRPAKIGYKWAGIMNKLRFQFIANTGTTTNKTVQVDRIELMPDTTVVDNEKEVVVTEYAEGVFSYPNPFNPRSNIILQCKINGQKKDFSPMVCIYNLQGRLLSRLSPERKQIAGKTGRFEYSWDGTHFASGTYIAVMRTDSKVWKKMILLVK